MTTKTIFDVFSDYQASKTNRSALFGVMHRFLASHWNGQAPKGSKATSEEVFSFKEIMKKTPATLLVGSKQVLEQEFIKKAASKDKSKSYRSSYKSFIDWAESNGYFLSVKENKEDIKSDVQPKLFTKKPAGSKKNKRNNYHGKTFKKPYTLMAQHNSKGEKSGKLIFPSDYVNANLANELQSFQLFRSQDTDCMKSTIQKDLEIIYRILGWLHRYKNVPLEELSLKSIITHIKLNISRSNFKDKKGRVNYHNYIHEKAMIREEAMDLANENKKLVEEYTNFIGKHPRTSVLAIDTIKAVAKFVFKDDIGTDDYTDYPDLPIIKKLNQLSNGLNKEAQSTPDSVPHSDKSVPWHEALRVLELLRKRVHCEKTQRTTTVKTKNGTKKYVANKTRNKSAIVHNLQTFLSLAFMLLIPTDRARTYYELEMEKTFVYGLYEDGKFTSIDKLKDKTQAIWYIHLMPGNYKTGKIYKEYWGIMPNVEFQDGHKLYEYIDSWINDGREYEEECNHNFFFRQVELYKPLTSSCWTHRIKKIFAQETDFPVTPKEIRKMYITHLNNCGATNAELKGAAYAMHHSQKMQESVYNSQTTFDRIAPIYELNERIWKDVITPHSEQMIAA